ncbi:hypothetical protein [Shimia sediminis]|uniref:hypothetical protein n=1 Tax=Shimia sediminis TaxID=2497945 RepID=UPI000F8D315E|nr:hypothetical protein [Shimia sediminis]
MPIKPPKKPTGKNSTGISVSITARGLMFLGAAVLVLAQFFMPADQTPAAFVGRTLTIAYTQANERISVIETMKEQLSINRQTYATTHAEAEAFKAKCGFLVLLGPLAEELMRQLPGGGYGMTAQQACTMLLEINYGPQLSELQSEIDRIEDEIKNLEGAL